MCPLLLYVAWIGAGEFPCIAEGFSGASPRGYEPWNIVCTYWCLHGVQGLLV